MLRLIMEHSTRHCNIASGSGMGKIQIPNPVPTIYNPNHVYQFFFQGGGVQNFAFSELQIGTMIIMVNWTFKIYYLGNMYWSNGVTSFNNLINPTASSNYISILIM